MYLFLLLSLSLLQEIFQAVRERYIKDGEGFLLVYSITEKSTFQTVKTIYSRIDKIKDAGGQPIPVILVGNKVKHTLSLSLSFNIVCVQTVPY